MEDNIEKTGRSRDGRPIRIVLVDDHVILRDGLQSLLEIEADFQIVGHAGSFDEGREVTASLKPDLVITDIRLAGDSGLKLIPELKALDPGVKALILSAHCNDEYVRAALAAGADGYMLKETSREELAKGIRAVVAGKQYLCSEVTTRVVSGFMDKDEDQRRRKASPLTDRETEVLTMIATAMSTKEIARKLDLSVKTVEKHRSNLMNKLDLRSSAAITLYAVRNNYVSADDPLSEDEI
jgi:DNA-binding NarL/FixJ family response regulator